MADQNLNNEIDDQDVIVPEVAGTFQSEADVRAFLPSKQSSMTNRTAEKKESSLRRRKSKKNASVKSLHPPDRLPSRRQFDGADSINVDDLSDESEIDDQEYHRQMSKVRSMTSSLSTKRTARSQIKQPTKSVSGVKGLTDQGVRRVKQSKKELLAGAEMWRGALKEIEGHFGSAVVSYFRFLKWLFWLNMILAVLLLAVIMMPQEIMEPRTFGDTLNITVLTLGKGNEAITEAPVSAARTQYADKYTDKHGASQQNDALIQAYNNSGIYEAYLANRAKNSTVADHVIDFFQGTGWMERTVLFYGYYFNKTFYFLDEVEGDNYNMPLGYLLAILTYFLLSLFAMVQYTASGVKDSLINKGEKFNKNCNKVLIGWDYNLTSQKAAIIMHKRLHREYGADLEEERQLQKLKDRGMCKRFCLYFLRFLLNLVVLAILCCAGYLIYFTSDAVAELSLNPDVNSNVFLELLVQFLPSITITGLNMVVPIIFGIIVRCEMYLPNMELNITIIRIVFLRLASVVILVVTLRSQVEACTSGSTTYECSLTGSGTGTICCCWETYVGQQFYKLVLLDFIVVIGVTFLVEFPRKLVVSKLGSEYQIVKMIGEQEFAIPKNVLDLVYSQILCWLGAVFSPLIPAITVAKFLIYFYIKKFTLLRNCAPSSRSYRASNSNRFFMTVLLLSFVLCGVIPVIYVITKVRPSRSCGPFRVYSDPSYVMWNSLTDAVELLPSGLKNILQIINSWTFYVPLGIILALVIYYYYAISTGYRRKIVQQKEQLASEGKDKQFLLNQVRLTLVNND